MQSDCSNLNPVWQSVLYQSDIIIAEYLLENEVRKIGERKVSSNKSTDAPISRKFLQQEDDPSVDIIEFGDKYFSYNWGKILGNEYIIYFQNESEEKVYAKLNSREYLVISSKDGGKIVKEWIEIQASVHKNIECGMKFLVLQGYYKILKYLEKRLLD